MSHFQGALIGPFFAFLAVMSPLANAPVFVGLTAPFSSAERHSIALRGVLVALCTVAASTLGGMLVPQTFGITVAAVRAFGSLLATFSPWPCQQRRGRARQGTRASPPRGITYSCWTMPLLPAPGGIDRTYCTRTSSSATRTRK